MHYVIPMIDWVKLMYNVRFFMNKEETDPLIQFFFITFNNDNNSNLQLLIAGIAGTSLCVASVA